MWPPMGSMAISVPREKSVSPTTRINMPQTISINVPLGIGTTVKWSNKMMRLMGQTACNDSFNFSNKTRFIIPSFQHISVR